MGNACDRHRRRHRRDVPGPRTEAGRRQRRGVRTRPHAFRRPARLPGGHRPDGSRALAACLPPELFDTFVATCARGPRHFNWLTEQLDPVLNMPLPAQDDPIDSEKSVSRMTLRQVLMTGVEDIVHFDKVFSRYEQRPDGKVTAHFEDGNLGHRRRAGRRRRQPLPGAPAIPAARQAARVRRDLGGRQGGDHRGEPRADLTGDVQGHLAGLRAQGNVLHPARDGVPLGPAGPHQGGIGRADAELLRQWPGLLYDNTRDYINWGFAASAKRLPANVMDLRGAELVKVVKDRTRGWSPNLRRLFDLTTCPPVSRSTS